MCTSRYVFFRLGRKHLIRQRSKDKRLLRRISVGSRSWILEAQSLNTSKQSKDMLQVCRARGCRHSCKEKNVWKEVPNCRKLSFDQTFERSPSILEKRRDLLDEVVSREVISGSAGRLPASYIQALLCLYAPARHEVSQPRHRSCPGTKACGAKV
eukprot:s516_g13.t1